MSSYTSGPPTDGSDRVTVSLPGIHAIRIRRRLNPIAAENARLKMMSKTEYLSSLVNHIAAGADDHLDPNRESPIRVDIAVTDEAWKKANLIAINQGFRTLADMVSALIEADWDSAQHHVEAP